MWLYYNTSTMPQRHTVYKGSGPECYFSSILYNQDIPFWSAILNMPLYHCKALQDKISVSLENYWQIHFSNTVKYPMHSLGKLFI